MNILTVAIDATETDQDLIAAAAFMHKHFPFQEIHFVHVMPRLMSVASKEVQNEAVSHSVTEKVRSILQERIDQAFEDTEAILKLTIRHGTPYRELHAEISAIAADLLIVGVKTRTTMALTPARVAHGFDCDVLFVPQGQPLKLDHIMVPVDLSSASGKTLRRALEMSAKGGKDEKDRSVTGVHVIQNLPIHYYYGFELNDTYIDQRSEEAKEAFSKMIAEEGLEPSSVREVHLDDKHGFVATHLNEYCREHPFDLIVINARGHSHLSNMLVGSVAEKFVSFCREVPIFLIR